MIGTRWQNNFTSFLHENKTKTTEKYINKSIVKKKNMKIKSRIMMQNANQHQPQQIPNTIALI